MMLLIIYSQLKSKWLYSLFQAHKGRRFSGMFKFLQDIRTDLNHRTKNSRQIDKRWANCGINPIYAIHNPAFTVNNGRTNIQQWLRQAFSPPPGCDAFSPNAPHWAELIRPCRAVEAFSGQQSAAANKSTCQRINNLITHRLCEVYKD